MEIFKTEEAFDQAISTGFTVVDIFATWCGPCKILSPVLDEISAEMEGVADFYKVDVDILPSIAQRYTVNTVPTIIIFRDGEILDQYSGVINKEELLEMINKQL